MISPLREHKAGVATGYLNLHTLGDQSRWRALQAALPKGEPEADDED